MKQLAFLAGMILGMGLLAACLPQTGDEPEATEVLTVPTAVPTERAGEEEGVAPAITPLPPAPTFVVPTRTPSPADGEGVALPTEGPPRYHVAFVMPDDKLNVRSGPGVEYDVAGEFAPDMTDIQITGAGELVDGSTWVPVLADGISGWVNGRFLARSVNEAIFCRDESVVELLDDLQTAVAEEDGALLSRLVHPERGLRLRLAWWNPEILVRAEEIAALFTSDVVYEWGVEDGSGEDITGTFAEVALPLLQTDLLQAEETGCNEIIHGGTAGWVKLPEGYEEISYYSFYRPGSEELGGLDWGTWVVGVEKWQGRYYISFLVHFQWEI